jgi:hypothetical protein
MTESTPETTGPATEAETIADSASVAGNAAVSVLVDPPIGEQADTDTDDQGTADEQADADQDGQNPNAEAIKWRRKYRAAEADVVRLTGLLERQRQAVVDNVAAARHVALPALMKAEEGYGLDSFLSDGVVDRPKWPRPSSCSHAAIACQAGRSPTRSRAKSHPPSAAPPGHKCYAVSE